MIEAEIIIMGMFILVFLVGLLLGSLVVLIIARGQSKGQIEEISSLKRDLARVETQAAVQAEVAEVKLKLLKESEEKLANSFKALSSEALKSNNESFLDLAKSTLERFQESAKGDLGRRQEAIDNLVTPIQKSLERFDEKVNALERSRQSAYTGMSEQIKSLLMTQTKLEGETSSLVKALRAPQVRGQWGEMQLKRTVEMAGMLNRVDFIEQESAETENGMQRPDMVINLPNGRKIVVDAKAPLSAYLDAVEGGGDSVQKSRLKAHARHVRDHLVKLGAKNYWKQFEPTPEFVVLFLPGEVFFSTALQEDPTLIDFGVENKVILATPTTLIALLKTVAYGWRQESIANEAKTISELGNTLYERIAVLAGHFGDIRKGLERSVVSYNKAVSSMESRVLPSARKFKELKAATGKEINKMESIETPLTIPATEELSLAD